MNPIYFTLPEKRILELQQENEELRIERIKLRNRANISPPMLMVTQVFCFIIGVLIGLAQGLGLL